jgi:ATP-dependent helicase/nuclease subunit B
MNLYTIPPHMPFLDALAAHWLDRAGPDPLAAADGLILLPTRRAARALNEAFLRQSNGRPLLLPRIAALGALDEAPLALAGALDLPPAVDGARRLAVLTRLVMALEGQFGAPGTADRAWQLAMELASLLDEAHRSEVRLADALPAAAEAGYAEHWSRTIEFLRIVTAAWPAWLADNSLLDAAERGIKLLDAQAAAWSERPAECPVIIAGTTGGIKAVARLMRVVAAMPEGMVVLPGLDLAMPDAVWEQLDPGHPQCGMQRLLINLGATRGDVQPWEEPDDAAPAVSPGRDAALCQSLMPAQALGGWRVPAAPEIQGLTRLEAADQQEEAVAIALALRDALQTPHARAVLVTPDRTLAVRVAAELGRYGVIVDDSAGEPLADTPPGAFLRLLARAVADGLAPVALLSLLKHPLAALGLRPAEARQAARRLELACLRGPAPAPGIAGLRAALDQQEAADLSALDLLDRLHAMMQPIFRIADRADATPADALAALIECAEALAETDELSGALRLWSREEGEALATHLSALASALPVLPAQPVATLPGLLDASMEGAVVRSRRALRGREGAEHPRVAILGLLEARLQSADLIVLGSLAEGVWPPATDPGPWMSRPMRTAAGLESPEERVGELAHDYAMLACAAPSVVLSCPRRRDGAPTVPARWLVRLEAYLAGHGTALPAHPAAAWARLLDQPAGEPRPAPPPQPRPPVDARPRRLSVTEIETWLRDPYAIYAKHVLRLRALQPLEQSADAADYGSIVHVALADFLTNLPATYPRDAEARLHAAMNRALDAAGLRPALTAWWRPRLARIADWVAEAERQRRLRGPMAHVASEVEGKWTVPGDHPFVLSGRADRIERRADGTLAILDYKTGAVPTTGQVEQGLAPQLPLEAAMAAAGVFGPELAGRTAELTYWHLSGGLDPGKETRLFQHDPARTAQEAETAERALAALIAAFDDPDRAYLSRPHPGAAPRFSDYAQLARVAEWAALEDDE